MLKKANYYSSIGLYWSVVLTCSLFVLVVLLGVLTRYIFKTPILGSVELSRLFFIWSCFMAASLGYYRKAHIYISFFSDQLPSKWLRSIHVLGYGVQLVFFLVILLNSLEVVHILWDTDLPMLEATQALLYLPVPVTMFFMALFCLEFLIDALSAPPLNEATYAVGANH